MVAALFIWIVPYNRILIPLASKIRGKPIRISAKRRMGIGLLVSFLHLVTAATFETIRRKKAIKYIRKLARHHYSYGNGYNSNGMAVYAPNMGNAVHTDTD